MSNSPFISGREAQRHADRQNLFGVCHGVADRLFEWSNRTGAARETQA